MTNKTTIAALTIAAALLTISAGAMAATALVDRTPSATPMGGALDLHGFTVMSPVLAGGPSATDYYAYYDSDGPNLPGIIRSYDDYSRYADAGGVAAASVLEDSSLMQLHGDDSLRSKLYGEFEYLFPSRAYLLDAQTASAPGAGGGQQG
jgi:hypothetical protein